LWTTANQLLEGVEIAGSPVDSSLNEALVDFEEQKVIFFKLFKGWIGVILLNLVHTGNLQVLAIFYNLAASNEHGFLHKTSKISINTPK